MECPSCGHDNAPGVKFCSSCGTEFGTEGQCSVCLSRNPPDSDFCTKCGAVLRCPNCSRSNVGDGRFCRWCQQFLVAPPGVKLAGLGRRAAAWILDIVLLLLTLIVGYFIWSLVFTYSRGQTPGKQLVGIRVMRVDGTASDWGWTFLREVGVKLIAFGVVGDILAGIPGIVDLLWAFWDKDRQTLHDKIMKTVVVEGLVLRSRPHETSPEVA